MIIYSISSIGIVKIRKYYVKLTKSENLPKKIKKQDDHPAS